MTNRYHIRQTVMPDGRSMTLYGWHKHEVASSVALPTVPPIPQVTPGVLTWHPLRQDFVCTSPARQNRTFKPDTASCPLCPTQSDGDTITEIPFADFELAVFDNRFPSYALPERSLSLSDPLLRPAHGKCEVVVYAPDHNQTLASLSDEQRLLLIEAWVHRYDTLLGLPGIEYVHPFENRGEAAGVTLHHPHGQIYAFPFIPRIQQTTGDAFKADPQLLAAYIATHPNHILAEQDGIVAFCPDFAEFSYEIWIAPRTPRSGLWSFDQAERRALAVLLGQVARAYDRLFDQIMPYLMAVHSAPPAFEQVWHSHITFQPFLRTADKLKYLASVELTTGHFLKDVTANDAVAILKPLFHTQDIP